MEKIDQQTQEDLNSGKKKIVGKWEYIFNYWSPIVALIGFLIAGVLWFANAEARMFTDAELRSQTEEHVKDSKDMDDIYIRKDQYNEQVKEMKDDLKEIQKDIKELLKRK